VKLLLQHGAKASSPDKEGRIASILATQKGNVHLIDILKAHELIS